MNVVRVTANRRFGELFLAFGRLWFSTASGYVAILVIIGIFAFIYDKPAPVWLAALGGMTWVAVMLPLRFSLQSWQVMRSARKVGVPVFTFDREGASCDVGTARTCAPWGNFRRIEQTRSTFFIHARSGSSWFFARHELSAEDEAAVVGFARAAGLKIVGRDRSSVT